MSRPRISIWRGARLQTPIRWYGSARSTCSQTSPPRKSGRWYRRCSPIPIAAGARAVALLAAVPTVSQPPADRPEARSMLGNFPARRGLLSDAEVEYKAAVRLSPQYGPAAINLADLYRQLGRDGEGESVLRAAIDASAQEAGLHHALGLALTRLKRTDEAISELRTAA